MTRVRERVMIVLGVALLLYAVWPRSVSSAAPTLSVSAPSTSFIDEVILVDARLSSGVSAFPQSDSSPSVTINFGDGFTCNLLACGHAYRTAGTYTITLTGKAANGDTATTTASITVSGIPAATGGNIVTLTDSGNATTNATNLQNAITAAAAANTVEREILLPNSAVFAGPITMPVPTGSKYITIRWINSQLIPHQRRVSPATDGSLMPVITAPSSGGSSTPALRTPATAPSSPPHHYRIQGVHLKKDNESMPATRLLDIGTDSGGGQDAISKIPHHFIVDRCWFDGGASDTSQVTNGIRVYSNYTSVVDSYLGEFRLIGIGVDTAAISLASGQGPYAFWNNTMIAGSENFNASGGPTELNSATVSNPTTTSATLSSVTNLALDQNIALQVNGSYSEKYSTIIRSISGNNVTFDPVPIAPTSGGTAVWMATPSFMEFRQNYLYKNLCWRASNPCYNGQNTQIKNLFELKFGRYFVIDGNVFENTWIKDQDYAIVIAVRGGGNSPASVVRQIQFSNNIVRNAAKGITLQAGDPNDPTQLQTDLTFRNNLFRNVGVNWDGSGAGHQLINYNPANDGVGGVVLLKRVFKIHNTDDNGTPSNENMSISDFGSQGGALESYYLNNVSQDCGFGFFSSSSSNSATNITTFLPPGNATNWNKNLIVNTNGHTYPAAAITQTATWTAQFVNYNSGDFTLVSSSPGKNAATDGTDIGVNMTTLTAATLHTVDGNWSAQPTPTPTPTPVESFTITGVNTSNGTPLANVSMRLLRASDRSLITSSNSAGNGTYSLGAAAGMSVIVSPSLAGFTFNPSEVLYSTIGSNKTQNFAASAVVTPTPTPTPLPTATPTPTPAPSPTPGRVCGPNELISSGCTCLTKIVGPPNARRCRP